MTIEGLHGNHDDIEDESFNTGSDKIYQNYMMPGLELYDAKISINHWQLRDCLKHSSTDPGKLYYIYDHQIRSLDTGHNNFKEYQGAYRSKKANQSKIRRNSFNVVRKYSPVSKSLSNSVRGNLNVPSVKVADFNFKPRSFTESGGLIACGGLIGPDDKGFPTSWSRISNELNNGEPLPPPAEPITLSNSSVLSDHSNYSNPNIWKGILSLYNSNTGVSSSFIVGQFINNCVTLCARSNQEYDLYTCNNDGHLYQCQINNRGVELVRRYSDLKFALNNATISHDSKILIASGDSNKFAIYRQNELEGQFLLSYDNQPDWGNSVARSKRIPRFALPDNSGFVDHIYEAPNGDHGFYSSFSENDLQFATVFQNGVCLVYDVRNMNTPLSEITSTRPHSHNGAFRVCKFSYGLDDLLFVSEHQGRVHVVDTRNFMNHQVILIPDKLKSETEELISTSNNDSSNTDSRRETIPLVSALSRASSSSSLASFATASRRRHSNPTPPPSINTEPWLTSATSIPLKYLEPQVVPYPRVVNRLTNNFATSLQQVNDSQQYENRTQSDARIRRRSSYRIRRFSTSSNTCSNTEGIDPAILDGQNPEQGYPRVENRSQGEQRTGMLTSDPRARTSTGTAFEEDEIYDIYNDINTETPRRYNVRSYLSLNQYSIDSLTSNYSNAEFTEENNISGIDWIEDRYGSSLLIGTDYGIMKWNINSWARRSFSSYDLC